MKTKIKMVLLVLTLSIFCSIGMVAAQYSADAQGGVGNSPVSCHNYISDDQKQCGASTSAGNNSIQVSVSFTYYYSDMNLGRIVNNGGGTSGHGGAVLSGPTLGNYQHYLKVVSNHVATYQNERYTCTDLTTAIQ